MPKHPPPLSPAEIDAQYEGFPTLEAWAGLSVDSLRWSRYTAKIDALRSEPDDVLARSRRVVENAAAIDTGAIEGLYETDQGFTITVAMEGALMSAALREKGDAFRRTVIAQLGAYDYVLDLATEREGIAEAWIRVLHEKVCHGQETYMVQTPLGPQTQGLPKGQYKVHPNHVRDRYGEVHAWAPVDLVLAEMHCLVEALNSPDFHSLHPVVQASFAHYSFVSVHPFADGNGRVARALASVYTYRAISIPFLVLFDNKAPYLDTLHAADEGDLQAVVDFTLERIIDAVDLYSLAVEAGRAPPDEDLRKRLDNLYVTAGGYTHADVDQAGERLFDAALEELETAAKEWEQKGVLSTGVSTRGRASAATPGHRPVPRRAKPLRAHVSTMAPKKASSGFDMWLEVSVDAPREGLLLIRSAERTELEARITNLMPDVATSLRLQLRIWADGVFRRLVSAVLEEAGSK